MVHKAKDRQREQIDTNRWDKKPQYPLGKRIYRAGRPWVYVHKVATDVQSVN